jgi:hypothetical protein
MGGRKEEKVNEEVMLIVDLSAERSQSLSRSLYLARIPLFPTLLLGCFSSGFQVTWHRCQSISEWRRENTAEDQQGTVGCDL